MIDDAGQGEPMINRARSVAAGFADVGLTHAEELLRRMSPEGRQHARRERKAKARRQKRLMARLAIAAIAALLAWAALAAVFAPNVALAGASALMLILAMVVLMRADPKAPGREALAAATIDGVAEEAVAWLAAQRRVLPIPAVQLTATISGRIDDLAPQLGQLDPRSPAAASIRKLIAVELPELIGTWRAIPNPVRRVPQADGRTPDEHLMNGLRLIDAELARANEQLGYGMSHEIAVLGRYLELKYDGDQIPRIDRGSSQV